MASSPSKTFFGVVVYSVVVGRARCRIQNVGVIVCGVLVAVVIVSGVVIYDLVTLPARYLKSSRISMCHPSDHLLDYDWHFKCHTLVTCNNVTGL